MSIELQTKPYTDKEIYSTFNPIITEWWNKKYKDFSPPQKFSIVNIHKKENTLISSPTGSGKTLSAFLAIINELTSMQAKKELNQKVYCIYISPLKALGNDIEKNLIEPLEEIKKILLKTKTGKDIILIVLSEQTEFKEVIEKVFKKAKLL